MTPYEPDILASLAAILVTAELTRNCIHLLPKKGGNAGERGAGSPDKDAFSLDQEEK